jgi:hypothetical protein
MKYVDQVKDPNKPNSPLMHFAFPATKGQSIDAIELRQEMGFTYFVIIKFFNYLLL